MYARGQRRSPPDTFLVSFDERGESAANGPLEHPALTAGAEYAERPGSAQRWPLLLDRFPVACGGDAARG
jgi:hypothetical protein